MIPRPGLLRRRMRSALCHLGCNQGTVYRPVRDEHGGLMDTEQAIGRVAGYPYRKAQATSHITIALPGQIDEGDPSVSHLLVLYGSRTESGPMEYDPPEAQKDDALVMDGGARYRVLSVMDVLDGAYQVYRLKEV